MFTCDGYKQIAFYKMVLRFSSSVSLRLKVCVQQCMWQCVYVQQHLGTWMCIILCGPFQSDSIVLFFSAGNEINTRE